MVWAVNPDLTGAQVKQIICSTATRQVGYSQEAQDEIDSNRFDPTLTYGLVDAELAVYAALSRWRSPTRHSGYPRVPWARSPMWRRPAATAGA